MLASAKTIHEFWFGALDEQGCADAAHRQRWFTKDAAFDRELADRFEATLHAAGRGELGDWLTDPKDWLSYILLCDQFPRNIYRGSASAFDYDTLALAAAQQGLAKSYDASLSIDERAFAFLPFEHSEDRLNQFLSVGLFATLRDQAPAAQRSAAGNYLRFAQQHRDVILRYGRFPHRNAVLGRASTPVEQRYLEEGGGFA